MSIIRNLAQQKKKKEVEMDLYNSDLNYLFYGEFGKSTTAAALSMFTDEPVLLISPAGGSTFLESDFPNIISYPVADLKELEILLTDLKKNMEIIRRLHIAITAGDKAKIAVAKTHYEKEGEDFEGYIYPMAKAGKFPIGAIVMEELSQASNWIQTAMEKDLDTVAAGEDKKSMGMDWNILKRRLMEFYGHFLKLPCTTILSTGSKLPAESQTLNSIVPNICTGSADRQLRDLVGNVFYFYKNDDNRFMVRLQGTKKMYAKDKILSPYTTQTLPEEIDITGSPETFWDTLNSLREKDKNDRMKSMLKNQAKKQ